MRQSVGRPSVSTMIETIARPAGSRPRRQLPIVAVAQVANQASGRVAGEVSRPATASARAAAACAGSCSIVRSARSARTARPCDRGGSDRRLGRHLDLRLRRDDWRGLGLLSRRSFFLACALRPGLRRRWLGRGRRLFGDVEGLELLDGAIHGLDVEPGEDEHSQRSMDEQHRGKRLCAVILLSSAVSSHRTRSGRATHMVGESLPLFRPSSSLAQAAHAASRSMVRRDSKEVSI